MIDIVKTYWEYYYTACSLAANFHYGQVDKAGAPYYQHAKRVAEAILDSYDFDIINNLEKVFVLSCATVGVLHDIFEDTICTEFYLKEKGFPSDIIDGVKSVTRKENESYRDFVMRAAENPYGKIVKLYDLKDNLDLTRLEKITEKDISRINKYLKWYKYLNNNENN